MRNARTRGAFFLRGGRRDESPPARRRRSRLKTETTSPKFRVRARRAPTGPPPRREERTRVSFLPCFAFEIFFANDTERTDRRVRREKRYRITTVYRAKNRTSARTHVGPHYTTPLTKNKKKKASAAKKDATMVDYLRDRERVAPFSKATRHFLFRPTHTASPLSPILKLSSNSKPLGTQCCRYSDEHAYPTRPGTCDANKPHLSPAPNRVAIDTKRSISRCDHSPCFAASPGRLCR